MKKLRVFISSVQSEFDQERQALWEYLNTAAFWKKSPTVFYQF